MTRAIRLATPDDGPALAAIYAPAVTDVATSFELEPPDAAEMARRVAARLVIYPWIVCERRREVVGYAYGGAFRERAAYAWSVEVSAYVRPDMHRAGIGRALYRSLFAILVLQGFRNAYAGITLPNPASVGLHLSVGFVQVGVFRGVGYKQGRWHDVAFFERLLADRIDGPPEPRALPDVVDTGAFEAAIRSGLPLLRFPD
jgi:phosphinothricin acetyltransferase